jgi:hypothetical protein
MTRQMLADMTGAAPNTVKFWLNAHKTVIPANTLRGLLYDLNARFG